MLFRNRNLPSHTVHVPIHIQYPPLHAAGDLFLFNILLFLVFRGLLVALSKKHGFLLVSYSHCSTSYLHTRP